MLLEKFLLGKIYCHVHGNLIILIYIFIYQSVILIYYNFSRLPQPSFPILNLFGELILDSLIIAVVAYGFSLSMAKLIAKKFNYGINGNQELMGEVNIHHIGNFKSRKSRNWWLYQYILENQNLGWKLVILFEKEIFFSSHSCNCQGLCNVFGAFFRCLPSSASMSRSLAVAASGGKTQLTGFLSSILLIFVLLWIGPLFEQLPKV